MSKTSRKSKSKRTSQSGKKPQPMQDQAPKTASTEAFHLKEKIVAEAIKLANKEVHHIGYLVDAANRLQELRD